MLCPVRRPVATLDCVYAVGLGPKINFKARLWVLIRPAPTLPSAGCLSSVLSFSFSLSTLVNPCHYHSTSAPYSYLIHLSLMLYNFSNWQQHYIRHFEEIIYFMCVICVSLKNQGIYDEKLAPHFISKCILLFLMQFCTRGLHQKPSNSVLHHFDQ